MRTYEVILHRNQEIIDMYEIKDTKLFINYSHN